ncbi:unnamed protein product [Soboliphyme baturini]|uniref:Adenylate kinase isoenzyme 6 homolog n=1 Tax=Soboliphyme baturini TaxID=241478 RepID=A0A183IPE2_9BILA|nr:unnamed protein product [Soboliphyme baturini]
MLRAEPNILVTGTPGCGKSILAEQLAVRSGLTYASVAKIAANNNFYEEYDENYECYVLDEEKLVDYMEDQMDRGGNIVDYHGCDLFPQRWFDAVFVLRTDNTVLYDRLMRRNYNPKKLQENIECEIFGVLYEEAVQSYDPTIVYQLQNDTFENLEINIDRICEWIQNWRNQVR